MDRETVRGDSVERSPESNQYGGKTMSRLFEVEQEGQYHEHWRAVDHQDAAERAAEHAEEIGVMVTKLKVSRMCAPEVDENNPEGNGLVYVFNDTKTFRIDGVGV